MPRDFPFGKGMPDPGTPRYVRRASPAGFSSFYNVSGSRQPTGVRSVRTTHTPYRTQAKTAHVPTTRFPCCCVLQRTRPSKAHTRYNNGRPLHTHTYIYIYIYVTTQNEHIHTTRYTYIYIYIYISQHTQPNTTRPSKAHTRYNGRPLHIYIHIHIYALVYQRTANRINPQNTRHSVTLPCSCRLAC